MLSFPFLSFLHYHNHLITYSYPSKQTKFFHIAKSQSKPLDMVSASKLILDESYAKAAPHKKDRLELAINSARTSSLVQVAQFAFLPRNINANRSTSKHQLPFCLTPNLDPVLPLFCNLASLSLSRSPGLKAPPAPTLLIIGKSPKVSFPDF